MKESFDASKVVTKVKVVGKEKTEGHQSVEAVVEGNTELGTRQVIYRRKDKETLAEAEAAAKKLLTKTACKEKLRLRLLTFRLSAKAIRYVCARPSAKDTSS